MDGAPWLAPIGLRESVQGNHLRWPLPLWEIFVHAGTVWTKTNATIVGSRRGLEKSGRWSLRHELDDGATHATRNLLVST